MSSRVEGFTLARFCRITAAVGSPALIAIAGILYIACASGNLWLDEILSLQWARNAKTWTDLIALFRHDNNHPLNSLWLYVVGVGHAPLVYRAVSVLAGIGSLVVLNRIAKRLVPRARLFVVAMAVISYALAVFFSEARGYAMAVFCALFCFWILLGSKDRPARLSVIGFWISAVAGFLSHATFVYPLGGMAIWVMACGLGAGRSPWKLLARTAIWFALPTGLFVAYYFYYLRQMIIAGGPDIIPLQIAAEFFGFGLGLPVRPPFAFFTVLTSGLALLAALLFGRFEGERLRIFFVSTLLLLPCIGVAVTSPEYLHFRYFLVLLPFVLLVLGGLIERALVSDSRWAFVFFILLCASATFQWPRFSALLTIGRGGYPEVLERMSSSGGPVTFSATHDMMGGLVLEHYRRQMVPIPPVHFLPAARVEGNIPEWFLVVDQSDPPALASPDFLIFDHSYQFHSAVYSAPVSGAHWFLYHLKKTMPSTH